jgi:hypothetical protein
MYAVKYGTVILNQLIVHFVYIELKGVYKSKSATNK